MKKAFLTLVVLCAMAMMTGCKGGAANEDAADSIIGIESTDTQHSKGGLEHDWQLLLLGEWDAVCWSFECNYLIEVDENSKTCKDWTADPEFKWRFNDDGTYDEIFVDETHSYPYIISNDSLTMGEDHCGDENPLWIIDTFTTEKLVLVQEDSNEECKVKNTLTLLRVK